jgi:heme/copper-type cytochrome/quinol oxidase subunit 2
MYVYVEREEVVENAFGILIIIIIIIIIIYLHVINCTILHIVYKYRKKKQQ